MNREEIPSTKEAEKVLEWGAYTDGDIANLGIFENLMGKEVDLYAEFKGWNESFPVELTKEVGERGKTLVIFWEPSFGYDEIINGSKDAYIQEFAQSAKEYKHEVILSPFDEMNLNENDWGYGIHNNNAEKFKTAWIRIHNMFAGADNVKFVITYNNVSVPDISGNKIEDYYPGDEYVDYIGVDGFNFGDPWQTWESLFPITLIDRLSSYKKPIYIMSTATLPGPKKSEWIKDMGTGIHKYPQIVGFIWFNQKNKNENWLINANQDNDALEIFRSILP
ncbi:MAG: hypothetical protein M3Q34_00785 [bacterium]|nr:hypothetical protein [bacterium]